MPPSSPIDLYPSIQHDGTVSPEIESHIDGICNEIHLACKGWTTNKTRLIHAMANTTGEERYKVSIRFEELHGTSLYDLVKSEVSGDLGMALELLALSPAGADAKLVHDALKGKNSHFKDYLYTVLCGRTDDDMDALKREYFKVYTEDLTTVIESETKGSLQKIFLHCLQTVQEEYNSYYHTEEKVEEDVNALYKGGQGKWFGTDEEVMFKILCTSPPEHLKATDVAYTKKHGTNLSTAFEKEIKKGDAQKAASFALQMKLDPFETVAKLIDTSFATFATDDELLTTCIIRYQGIMKDVQEAHIKLFNKTIQQSVNSKTFHKFHDVLIQVLNKACVME